jgi:hypothetical protein
MNNSYIACVDLLHKGNNFDVWEKNNFTLSKQLSFTSVDYYVVVRTIYPISPRRPRIRVGSVWSNVERALECQGFVAVWHG